MFRLPLHLMRGLVACMLCCLAQAVPSARADERSDIEQLHASGQHGAALARVESMLAQHPRDAQLRFQRAALLAQLQRRAEAQAAYTELAADYPEIPEVHNNLAVLYAADGEYEKARSALEEALRANPSYAVAQQNLGDIYVQLARQSYERVLQLDPSNTVASRKLSMLRELTSSQSPLSPPHPTP